MDFDNRNCQAREEKLSEQFVEFIDLTDEALEEVTVLELSRVHGSRCGMGNCSNAGGACNCGDCYSPGRTNVRWRGWRGGRL